MKLDPSRVDARIVKAVQLHAEVRGRCTECGFRYPCETVRVLVLDKR